MDLDYSKLQGRILEKNGSQEKFVKAIKMDRNGKIPWNRRMLPCVHSF